MVITANAPMVAGTGTAVVGTLTCRNDGHASVEPHHSGRRPARHAVEEPTRGRQEVCGPVPTGALDAIGLQTRLRLGPIQQVRGVCRPEVRLPVADHHPRDERPSVITIGIDPHKRSVTAIALDAHSQPLGTLRVAMTDQAVAQLLAWVGPWPPRRSRRYCGGCRPRAAAVGRPAWRAHRP